MSVGYVKLHNYLEVFTNKKEENYLNHLEVFYLEGKGFGCLHSACNV